MPSIEQRQADLIRQMSPARRLEIASDLYRTAWEIKCAALRQQHGDWTETRIQSTARRIFQTGYAG